MIYIFIFILTLADIGLTVCGATKEYIEEANPLWEKAMHAQPILTGIGLAIFVGLLLLFISKQKFKWIGYVLAGLVVVKIGVLILHADWIRAWGF